MFNQTLKDVTSGIVYTGAEWLSKLHMHIPYVDCFIILSALIVAGEFTDRTFFQGLMVRIFKRKGISCKNNNIFCGDITGYADTCPDRDGDSDNYVWVWYESKYRYSFLYCENVRLLYHWGYRFWRICFLWAMPGRSRVAAIGLNYGNWEN